MRDTPRTDAVIKQFGGFYEMLPLARQLERENRALLDESYMLIAALKAMRTVMDKGPQPRKLDEALTWRECDIKARAMCDAAIAKAEKC